MIITVAISTFMCSVECVPISNGETVPDDGESKCVIVCPLRKRMSETEMRFLNREK